MNGMRRRRFAIVAAAIALVTLAGCAQHTTPTRPSLPAPPPAPNSPVAAVRLFQWAWDQRNDDRLAEVLPGEFRFVSVSGDSAGNPFRDPALDFDRDEMWLATHHLFKGGGNEPAAFSIALDLDRTLGALPDDRPGRHPRWHRVVDTSVDLTVLTVAGEYRVHGGARFYAVRGDSAVIPADLVARGFTPDSARWYVDRVEDGTGVSPAAATGARPARALPTHTTTWGQILALYLP